MLTSLALRQGIPALVGNLSPRLPPYVMAAALICVGLLLLSLAGHLGGWLSGRRL